MQQEIHHLIYDYAYLKVYGWVFIYFLLLYFVLGPIFLTVCQYLSSKNILHKIIDQPVSRAQIRYEILHSIQSIVIFGFSAFPLIFLVRTGVIRLLPDTVFNVLWGIILLTIWNEIHFFIIHRLMHLPFFMRHIHIVHHKSHIPTVYSVFSFHGLEAFLLSTVSVTIAPFIPFAPLAIFLFPLVSVLLNYAGHCNYRFGNGSGHEWRLLGTRHNEHHVRGSRNYGFASNLLDKFYTRLHDHKNSH